MNMFLNIKLKKKIIIIINIMTENNINDMQIESNQVKNLSYRDVYNLRKATSVSITKCL